MTDHDCSAVERRLEADFAMAQAVFVGRAALGLASVLRCWSDRTQRDRIAVPAAVCHDVVLAILESGCTPVFCDIDPATGIVPHSEWARARAVGASVAIVVHLYGNPADATDVKRIFGDGDCLVVDDAAQAYGTSMHGIPAGAQGDVGLLSFGATKQISVGGAALLFRDSALGAEVRTAVASTEIASSSVRVALQTEFRRKLEAARALSRGRSDRRPEFFRGLMDGQEATLRIGPGDRYGAMVLRELDRYDVVAKERLAKRDIWVDSIRNLALEPVGMSGNGVPWRFVCRLPGINWSEQHLLGQAMRSRGMNVSHWYLPAHWMHDATPAVLPGVETLAREVFQFWIDEGTALEEVHRQGKVVAEILSNQDWIR